MELGQFDYRVEVLPLHESKPNQMAQSKLQRQVPADWDSLRPRSTRNQQRIAGPPLRGVCPMAPKRGDMRILEVSHRQLIPSRRPYGPGNVPVLTALVQGLPPGLDALVVTADLQALEAAGNRMLGEAAAE